MPSYQCRECCYKGSRKCDLKNHIKRTHKRDAIEDELQALQALQAMSETYTKEEIEDTSLPCVKILEKYISEKEKDNVEIDIIARIRNIKKYIDTYKKNINSGEYIVLNDFLELNAKMNENIEKLREYYKNIIEDFPIYHSFKVELSTQEFDDEANKNRELYCEEDDGTKTKFYRTQKYMAIRSVEWLIDDMLCLSYEISSSSVILEEMGKYTTFSKEHDKCRFEKREDINEDKIETLKGKLDKIVYFTMMYEKFIYINRTVFSCLDKVMTEMNYKTLKIARKTDTDIMERYLNDEF